MEATKRTTVPALRVRQWLDAWEDVKFGPKAHRRRPSEHFYVTSIKASQLRALCAIHRRSSERSGSRKSDLGVQRRHNEARSREIAEFVRNGFPWSAISQSARKSGDFNDLKKPGWLPTAIVVNVLISEDVREGGAVAPEDLVEVIDDGESASLVFPEGISPTWRPKKTAPISAAPEVKQSTFALLMRAESLRIESDRLTSLRDALLPELLSGRMRVRGEGWAA